LAIGDIDGNEIDSGTFLHLINLLFSSIWEMMKTYRIYKHPEKSLAMVVKVGFSWGAFFFGPLWFLFNKMWLNFALVATLSVAANLAFQNNHPANKTDALIFLGMYVLYLIVWFFIGKVANILLCSDLKAQGYVLQATVQAKNPSYAREAAAVPINAGPIN